MYMHIHTYYGHARRACNLHCLSLSLHAFAFIDEQGGADPGQPIFGLEEANDKRITEKQRVGLGFGFYEIEGFVSCSAFCAWYLGK